MAASLAELEVLISLQTIGQGQLNSLKSSLLGLGTGVGVAALALGGLYELGKASLDNYEKQQGAVSQLAQAFATQGKAVPTTEIQAFLDKNKGFISDQYDVENAIAAATRAGLSWKDTQLLMSDALGLSIDRNISYSDAMDTLIKAAAGGRVQLAYLGITTKALTADSTVLTTAQKEATKADAAKAAADRTLQEELVRLHDKHTITQNDLMHLADLKAKDLKATQDDAAAHKALSDAQNSVNAAGDKAVAVHNALAPKLAGEQATVSKLQQDQQSLNKDWQDFTAKIGPGVSTVLDGVVQALDAAVQGVEALGNDLGAIGDWLQAHSGLGANETSSGPPGGGRAGALGARANPPSGGGAKVTINVSGAQQPQATARAISRNLQKIGAV